MAILCEGYANEAHDMISSKSRVSDYDLKTVRTIEQELLTCFRLRTAEILSECNQGLSVFYHQNPPDLH